MIDALKTPPPNTLQIKLYLHCDLCVKEKPPGKSMQEWALQESGFTPWGLQIWCRRHQANICHIHFEGQKHPANTSRALPTIVGFQNGRR